MTSIPPPEPRSSTTSPGFSSATATGFPQRQCSSKHLRDIDKGRQPCDRTGVEREVGPFAALLALEQAHLRQLLQVMADRRLRKTERRLELARTHGLVASREEIEDLDP